MGNSIRIHQHLSKFHKINTHSTLQMKHAIVLWRNFLLSFIHAKKERNFKVIFSLKLLLQPDLLFELDDKRNKRRNKSVFF